jgi:Fe-S oxidoreductase
LLRLVAGENFIELKNADSCCGFAGSFSMDYPELSKALLEEKVDSLRESGADLVCLDCPGCLLQIRGGCHASHLPIRVQHLAEILADRLAD